MSINCSVYKMSWLTKSSNILWTWSDIFKLLVQRHISVINEKHQTEENSTSENVWRYLEDLLKRSDQINLHSCWSIFSAKLTKHFYILWRFYSFFRVQLIISYTCNMHCWRNYFTTLSNHSRIIKWTPHFYSEIQPPETEVLLLAAWI